MLRDGVKMSWSTGRVFLAFSYMLMVFFSHRFWIS
jgi:hypothetical protein